MTNEDIETLARALFLNWRERRHPGGGVTWDGLSTDSRGWFVSDAIVAIEVIKALETRDLPS